MSAQQQSPEAPAWPVAGETWDAREPVYSQRVISCDGRTVVSVQIADDGTEIPRYAKDSNLYVEPLEKWMRDMKPREDASPLPAYEARIQALEDGLRDCAESLELALGRLGCSVEGNNGGAAGHDADSYGGVASLDRARALLSKAAQGGENG